MQRDANDLAKVVEDTNRKCEELTNKRRDTQAAWEKHEAEQYNADAKVRGKLLANAVVAEVRRQFVRKADKAQYGTGGVAVAV